ncbi:ribonuclease H-like protein [Tothia fuscella]|uniref:poly(A)-specific ribonuclease n=1 Tax=Tothia fuscella TaxID=1048955 RepID=A0A9P4TSQ9_9PEZI|nr:ribonuclease H-like protein [Tothia fuscella]
MAQQRSHAQNPSNPFAGYNASTSHTNHPNQQLHLSQQQHPHANLQSHGMGVHPAFGGVAGMNIFGPQATNGSLLGGFGGAGTLGGSGIGLASQAAQMGFAHGAQLQQQAHDAANAGVPQSQGANGRTREVWANNMDLEMDLLAEVVRDYPYISVDTEFPGIVARPIGEFNSKASYHYQTLRANVDLLRILQLGITLFNSSGKEVPANYLDTLGDRNPYPSNITTCPCTWSFNFRFDVEKDMYNEESLQLLRKAGFDFDKLPTMGIDPLRFGYRLVSSGLAYSDDVHWISFHSGYDFGYLTKIMWNQELPVNEDEYRDKIRMYFPNIWDVKFMMKHAQSLQKRGALSAQGTAILNNLGIRSGLQDLADELGCARVGTIHQAGSDAWLTGTTFWQTKDKLFNGELPEGTNGQMWGLAPANGGVTNYTGSASLRPASSTVASGK